MAAISRMMPECHHVAKSRPKLGMLRGVLREAFQKQPTYPRAGFRIISKRKTFLYFSLNVKAMLFFLSKLGIAKWSLASVWLLFLWIMMILSHLYLGHVCQAV